MITGDKSFGPGHERFELQKSAVEELEVIYYGWRNRWPKLPAGKFDVVTAQDPFWRGLFGWRAARQLGAKFNVQVHTDLSVYGGLRRVLMQIVLRHADSVRVVSEKIKQQVLKIVPQVRVSVLPVFVDVVRFRAIEPRPHQPKTILWVGRFEDEKDPLAALEVFKSIPDAKLIMLGKGSLEGGLRDKAHGLAVEFPGWQDSAPFLAQADAVLCTSKHESYGASIIEALAAGLAVVAPDVGVAREAGATVVPREQLAGAVIHALKTGARGELKLRLLDKNAWAEAWKQSL